MKDVHTTDLMRTSNHYCTMRYANFMGFLHKDRSEATVAGEDQSSIVVMSVHNRLRGCHSAEVHELFHAFVRRPETLAEHLKRVHCLCCVRHGLGHGEVQTMLRVVMMFCAGAHDVRV